MNNGGTGIGEGPRSWAEEVHSSSVLAVPCRVVQAAGRAPEALGRACLAIYIRGSRPQVSRLQGLGSVKQFGCMPACVLALTRNLVVSKQHHCR